MRAKNQPNVTGIIFAVATGLALLSALIGKNGNSSSSNSSTPSYNHSNGSDLDTSESARRRVTDEMVRRGSDAAEAEAFTKEL
jgi:hypothetical protein